jgi:hypothetical protein
MQDVDTKEESYCPDYHNRKKEKETLEQLINRWIETKKYSVLELNNIINRYGKQN